MRNPLSACPPSSRVSPICHSAKPCGQGNTRRAHVSRRPLIMPLVALVQKQSQRTRNFVQNLVLGTRFGRRRCSSNSVFELVSACIVTPQNCQVKSNKWQFSELKCALNCGFCVLGLCQSINNYSEDNKHCNEHCGDDGECFVAHVLDEETH